MATITDEENHYIPGTCNIGKRELQYRRRVNYITWVVALAMVILLQVSHVSHLWRWILFPVLAGLLVNTQQVYFHFCVRFGASGVYNFGDVGPTYAVEQKEYARMDRIKAWRMIISSVVIAFILTLIYFYVPV